jgi:RNA polymerase sigma-70 factor, ECF subfamily
MAPSLALFATDQPYDFTEVYSAHAPRVARWVARLAGPRADVDDLMQEVFIRVHRRLSGFRGDCQLSTWIYAITENVVRSWRRRDRLRRLFGSVDDRAAERLPSREPDPALSLERRRSAALIYRALDELADHYRTIFILFEIDGLSGEEISQLTGVKLPTVWVRLNRARNQLADRLARLEVRR